MLTQNRLYPHLSYQGITELAQVLDNQLRDNWVIRIEYTKEIEYLNTYWQQWGKPFFNIKDPVEVMDNILACHINNQLCSIRLHAEKNMPVSNLYYSVCQVCQVSNDINRLSHMAVVPR